MGETTNIAWKKVRRDDPFSVWGHPPSPLDKLPPKHLNTLRGYVLAVTEQAYTIGYDNGLVEGLTKLSMVAAAELKRERERMFKRTSRGRGDGALPKEGK